MFRRVMSSTSTQSKRLMSSLEPVSPPTPSGFRIPGTLECSSMASESRSMSVGFSARSKPVSTSPETAEVSSDTPLDYSEASCTDTVSKSDLVDLIDTRIAELIVTVHSQSGPGLEGSCNKLEDKVVIANVSEEYYEAFLNYMDGEGLHTTRLDYDPETKSILIVELAGARHNRVADSLVMGAVALFNLAASGGDSEFPIVSFGSGRHGSGKVADKALKHHLDTRMHALECPLVLEVGDSQSMGSLQGKANMWLARGYIRLVLVISVIEYEDGSLALLFLAYDKVNCIRQGNHFIPTYAKSFGVAFHPQTITAITAHTRLAPAEINLSSTECDALGNPEYMYEVPQRVLFEGVPGWSDHDAAIPPFRIDLFRFRRAALAL